MNILGIDFGKKRIGLAWVQEGLDVVLPFGIVKSEGGRMKREAEIKKIIIDEKIDKVVVGFPLKADGEDTDNTEPVRDFVKELKQSVDIPIEIIDERFTTAQARQMGGDASLDEKAAMLILQSYLHKY